MAENKCKKPLKINSKGFFSMLDARFSMFGTKDEYRILNIEKRATKSQSRHIKGIHKRSSKFPRFKDFIVH